MKHSKVQLYIKDKVKIWKWFKWVLLGIFIVGLAIFGVTAYFGNKHDQQSSGFQNVPGLAKCPENLSGLLTYPIINPGDLKEIQPLGNLGGPGHTLTNHIYFILPQEKEAAQDTSVYSPGNITVSLIKDVTQYYRGELAQRRGPSRSDHGLDIYPCQGLRIEIDGFKTLSPKLENAKAGAKKNCDKFENPKEKDTKGIAGGQSCKYDVNLKMTAGELLGTTGGFEIGTFNKNKPINFINPKHYPVAGDMGDFLHGMCFFDLYPENLRANYNNLFGLFEFSNKPRTVEPRCGQLMQDLAGTLQGGWFDPNSKGDEQEDGMYAFLVHQNWDPTLGAISPGRAFYIDSVDADHALTFHPTHSGTHNREFSEVRPGTAIYCYDEDKSLGWGDYPFKFLIQLVDNTHIKIEKQKGNCGAGETFTNPFIYER